VLGARQTGKSTLLRKLLPDAALWLDFSEPGQRAEFLRAPERLVAQCRALPRSRKPAVVVVDEAQNVPAAFDAVQHLYDSDKSRWRFVVCGSSARKLRTSGANTLPGRAIRHSLYPLLIAERPLPQTPAGAVASRIPRLPPLGPQGFPPADLIERLTFGELPVIAVARPSARGDLLRTYSLVYLEEELRREALIKDWAAFARFLRLAAIESGQMITTPRSRRKPGCRCRP
jgi:predicted AAA+ superfamily ATPase